MEFVDDVDRLFGLLDETSPTVALRTLHTLKGNVALFGMSHLARIAHAIEDAVIDRGDTLDSDERARLQSHWEPIATQLRALEVERTTGLLSEDEWSARLDAINARQPYDELSRVLSSLRLEPVARRFDRVGEQARALAARMGRGDLDVEIDAGDLRLPREPTKPAPLWGALVHAVRNAIDHGIEAPAERVAAFGSSIWSATKCPPCGPTASRGAARNSPIRGSRSKSATDGRGVDWARIAAKARQMGTGALAVPVDRHRRAHPTTAALALGRRVGDRRLQLLTPRQRLGDPASHRRECAVGEVARTSRRHAALRSRPRRVARCAWRVSLDERRAHPVAPARRRAQQSP